MKEAGFMRRPLKTIEGIRAQMASSKK